MDLVGGLVGGGWIINGHLYIYTFDMSFVDE